jgi:hypothetical protein
MSDQDTDTVLINPASALHRIFSDWREAQEGTNQDRTPSHARGFHTAPDQALHIHRRAMRLIRSIDNCI